MRFLCARHEQHYFQVIENNKTTNNQMTLDSLSGRLAPLPNLIM